MLWVEKTGLKEHELLFKATTWRANRLGNFNIPIIAGLGQEIRSWAFFSHLQHISKNILVRT
jgi:hypothetical protein